MTAGSAGRPGPWQHLAQTRLRAIEQGLPVIRAANTGISAVIDSHGRYLRRLPLLEEGVIDSPLPVAIATTVYGVWGDAALLLLLVAIIGSSMILKFAIRPLICMALPANFADRGPVSGEKQLRAKILYIKRELQRLLWPSR